MRFRLQARANGSTMPAGFIRSVPSLKLRARNLPSLVIRKMIRFCLSMTGVSFTVFEQSQVAAHVDVAGLAKVFCQKTFPVSASSANIVSSAPSRKSRFFGPWGVLTPSATKGAVRVDRTMPLVGVLSRVFHSSLIRETLLLLSEVSPLFQPVRS